MRPLIKICGVTNIEDALCAAELNVWALGFVFADSPRKVSQELVKRIAARLPPRIARVGVFVNEDIKNIKRIATSCKLDMAQLHGDETPKTCGKVMEFVRVIKAFRLKDEDSLKVIPKYDVDLYLLDTFSRTRYGGTGTTFDWGLALKAKEYCKEVILAGGINPKNIIKAVNTVKPYALDVSSGVEEAPGRKSMALMKEIVTKMENL